MLFYVRHEMLRTNHKSPQAQLTLEASFSKATLMSPWLTHGCGLSPTQGLWVPVRQSLPQGKVSEG